MQNWIHSNCEIEYYDKLSKKMSIWNLAPKKWVYAEGGGIPIIWILKNRRRWVKPPPPSLDWPMNE